VKEHLKIFTIKIKSMHKKSISDERRFQWGWEMALTLAVGAVKIREALGWMAA
jgi:hypothetical protein